MKRKLTLCFLLLLSACFGLERVDELRHAPSTASPFHQQLAQHYLKFVDKELDKYDWDSAGYFAGKGLAASRGEPIEPEKPDAWNIPSYAQEELRSARASIMRKLSAAYMNAQPQSAAALLFNYDCWVEEQEEAWEIRAIERCKQQVMLHLNEMDTPVAMGGPLSSSYLFHFPDGESQLEGLALEELSLIATTLAQQGASEEVIIHGHADNAQDEPLSKARANFIEHYLVRNGVAEQYVRYQPYSDDPAVYEAASARSIELFIE